MPKYVFNTETLSFEAKDEPKSVRRIRAVLLLAAALGIALLNFWIYTSVLHLELPKTARLKWEHAAWEARMELINSRLDLYEQTLTGIEQRDDDVYRSIYGLSPIPSEVRTSDASSKDYSAVASSYDLLRADRHLDDLTRRAFVQSKALEEVGQLSKEAGDMLSCVPSIPPINPIKGTYTMSSPFGMRTDPVYGGGEMHTGQDISTRVGVPVYATGDGVVETTASSFGGYGNEIVINHGYGYKTRYAHLNTIDVAEGMKVQRGEQIGTVGNTGKSTGAHIHYEVLYRDNRVNPLNYFDMDMSSAEYKAMTDKRKAESPRGKMLSTSELLRKRGKL